MLEIVTLILGVLSVALGFYSPVHDFWRKRQGPGDPSESAACLTARSSPGRVYYYVQEFQSEDWD